MCDYPLLLAAFELKVCSLIGYRPRLLECAYCGTVLAGRSGYLSLGSGGVVCEKCVGQTESSRRVDAESLALAQSLLHEPMQRIAGLRVPEERSRKPSGSPSTSPNTTWSGPLDHTPSSSGTSPETATIKG